MEEGYNGWKRVEVDIELEMKLKPGNAFYITTDWSCKERITNLYIWQMCGCFAKLIPGSRVLRIAELKGKEVWYRPVESSN